jgi:hypothetical protein
MSVQAYVYSNIYDKSIQDPHIQHFLNLLIGLFTSTRIITDIPDSSKGKLNRLLRNIFLSHISKNQIGPNAIYRKFLMELMEIVNKQLNTEQLGLLDFNLTYIESESITGNITCIDAIKCGDKFNGFISNTYIQELIRTRLTHHDIPIKAYGLPATFDDMMSLGSKLLPHLERISVQGKSYRPVHKKHTETRKGPYSKPPCWHGSKCRHKDRLDHTSRFSHLSHSPSPKKSPSKKGGKRTSKKTYQCVRQTLKKYTSRDSPPYPAQECPYKRKKGNDGRMYVSKPNNTNGMFRWVPQ